MEFLGFDISGIVNILRIIGGILSVGFFVGIIISVLSLLNVIEIKKRRRESYFDRNEPQEEESQVEKRWSAIKVHFQSQNPAEWRIAIIDADSLLDEIITDLGYKGESMGEKLKSMNYNNFPLLDEAWTVHKLRNTIAHQGSHYSLSERELFQAFKIYEHIFHRTGYIS